MASLGHVFVGMAAARFARDGQRTIWTPFSAMVVWSSLSLLPDADTLGLAAGVPYEAPWGHRGATHSLAFAALVGLLTMLVAKAARLTVARTGLIAAVVVASHGLLDTLTDGGLGCALLWPISTERFFAPWRPLPVAPIGPDYFSMDGLRVGGIELLLFSPFLLYALWPRRTKTV